MKKFLAILFLFAVVQIFPQQIGEIQPPEPPVKFPSKASGFSLSFSDNGFGFGGFYRNEFGNNLSGFVSLSVSELKSEREIERYDYWGRPIVLGKVNRIFSIPLMFGLKRRLFAESLADNLRPYLLISAGPDLVITTDYNPDWFASFNNPKTHLAVAGTIGFGGNFGLSKKNLIGLSFSYQYIYLLDKNGVETLQGIYKREFGNLVLTLNIGWMFD